MAAALAAGRPVVALETAIIAHGLPRPVNLEVGLELEAAVRAAGAVPATIGVLAGVPRVGLAARDLEHLATAARVAKLSDRDLAPAALAGVDGATTVAGTLALAAAAGIRVLATGGIGGVHRGARESWDVSADCGALRRYPVLVVAAGVKSMLDAAATLEQLETLGVPVVGYRTRRLPGFLRRDGGLDLDWSVSTPAEAAALLRAHLALRPDPGGLVLANPVARARQLAQGLHDRASADARGRAASAGVAGKAATPLLLAELARATGGASVTVNRHLVLANARLAAAVAVAGCA